jgi:hypothetical protein
VGAEVNPVRGAAAVFALAADRPLRPKSFFNCVNILFSFGAWPLRFAG